MTPFEIKISDLYKQEVQKTTRFNWKKNVKKSALDEAAKAVGITALSPFLPTTVTGVFLAVLIINFVTEKGVDHLAHEKMISIGNKKIVKTGIKVALLATLLITALSFGFAPPLALVMGSLYACKLIYDLALHDIPLAQHEKKLQRALSKA